jgi:hypothetical protein
VSISSARFHGISTSSTFAPAASSASPAARVFAAISSWTSRDAHAVDAVEPFGDLELRPQARDVDGVWAGDHVLEQRAVRDRAREHAVVAVAIEVVRRSGRHPAVRRLEADHAVDRRRDADRTADI